MAKLYFRHGTVGSAKTLNLLAVAHNYERQEKRVVVFKPAMDTRLGVWEVASRSGLSRRADLLLEEGVEWDDEMIRGSHCVLVDEAQFLPASTIEGLREITRLHDVPVICYGLRTDFRTELFAGSRRLLELADSIEEIKTTCHYCTRKAIFNLKVRDGVPTKSGASCELGGEELFLPTCHECYVASVGPPGADDI